MKPSVDRSELEEIMRESERLIAEADQAIAHTRALMAAHRYDSAQVAAYASRLDDPRLMDKQALEQLNLSPSGNHPSGATQGQNRPSAPPPRLRRTRSMV